MAAQLLNEIRTSFNFSELKQNILSGVDTSSINNKLPKLSSIVPSTAPSSTVPSPASPNTVPSTAPSSTVPSPASPNTVPSTAPSFFPEPEVTSLTVPTPAQESNRSIFIILLCVLPIIIGGIFMALKSFSR